FLANQASGLLPCNTAPCSNPLTKPTVTVAIPGGASNALIDTSTMYVIGQQLQADGLFSGNLTVVNLANNTAGSPVSISDGATGAMSRIIEADDKTLWIGMTKC